MINDGLEVIEFHREERRLEDAFIDILGGADKARLSGPTPAPAGVDTPSPPAASQLTGPLK